MGTIKVFFLLLSTLGISFLTSAFDLTRINLNYHYDLSNDFRFEHKIVEKGENYQIYFRIFRDTTVNWQYALLTQDDYAQLDHDTVKDFSIDTLRQADYFNLVIPKNQVRKLLIFSFANLDAGLFRIFDVQINKSTGYPDFLVTDSEGLPVVENFVSEQRLIFPSGQKFHGYQYLEDFGPADPPMGQMKPLAPSLEIDSSFFLQDSLSALEDNRFYLFQKDTFDNVGITILKVPKYYPKYKRLGELVPPLTYITTSSENEALGVEVNQKKNFEAFWVNTFGTKFRARSAIKAYYDKIERANRLFTDYKPGWKTDRGIIYIIHGPPGVVVKTDRTEVWRYPDVEYEFIKISTLFAPILYSLKRDRSYEKDWYDKVGEIRKGNGW